MSGRVCVVVVTFNRKDLLRRCLLALQPQVGPDDRILVVDNLSTDGTRDMLDTEFPELERLDLPVNVGGAGGFNAGMRWGYERGFEHLWLMDDDGVPQSDCLQKLLEVEERPSVRVPIQRDSGGRLYGISAWRDRNVDVTEEIVSGGIPAVGRYMFSFVGPLIPRAVVDQVGYPNAEFFIWFDDYEYSLRIIDRTSIPVVALTDTTFHHDMGERSRVVRFLGKTSVRSDVAPWKIYYGIRNPLYTLTRQRKKPKELLLFGVVNARLMLMDAVYGPDRWLRIRMRMLGAADGVLGRLGKRVNP